MTRRCHLSRAGCLRGGVTDIKEHPWFAKLDWEKVLACRQPAPHVPRVRDEKDTSNFDEYPDSDSEVSHWRHDDHDDHDDVVSGGPVALR